MEEKVRAYAETIRRLLNEKLELTRKVDILESQLHAQDSIESRTGEMDAAFLERVGELVRPLIHDIKGQFPFVINVIEQARDHVQEHDCGDISGLIRRLNSCEATVKYLNMRMIGISYLGGKTPEVFTRIDFNELVRANINFIASRYDAATIETDFGEDPLEMWGDRESLDQIVSNLLLNAIEAYVSPPFLVRVRTSIIKASERTPHPLIELAIEDNGVGIYPNRQSIIYDLHYTTKKTGFGIGLYLVKKAVELHGGQIECESKPDAFTIFKVRLQVGEGKE